MRPDAGEARRIWAQHDVTTTMICKDGARREEITRGRRCLGLYVDHDLEGIADALRVGMERVVDLVEPEVVRDDRVGQDLALAHELERASAVHAALTARRLDAHVRAHGEVHVDLARARVPGDHADAAAALDVLERFLHRARAAGALEDAVGPPAARDLAHAVAEVLVADVD